MAQPLLMLSYRDQLHKCRLNSNKRQQITIGNDISDDVTSSTLDTRLSLQWDGNVCHVGEDTLRMNDQLKLQLKHTDEPIHMYLLEEKEGQLYDTSARRSVTFGPYDYDDVRIEDTAIDFALIRENRSAPFKLVVYEGSIYHNYARTAGDVVLEPGDQLYFDGITVIIGHDDIQLVGSEERLTTTLVPLVEAADPFDGEYPDYHRSPRIIHREPEDKLTIAKPSPKPSKPSEQLGRLIVPPLVMIVAMVIVSFFRAGGIFIIVMLSMTVTTIIFSITTYVKNVKQYKKDTKERDQRYREYLKDKTAELHRAREEQRHALEYHYPDVRRLRDMAVNVDARIYEKTMYHHDFLHYRVGLGQVKTSFEISFSDEEFSQEKDELVDAARALRTHYANVDNVPVVTSLVNGPVGYIGQRALVLEQLQLFVMQTALFHSYHEVQFIVVFPEEEKREWNWMRWLPHARLQEINVRGFVYHERSRDQVLHSLYQILKERKLTLEEKENSNEKTYFAPHYVVLITDEKIILDHTVMEFFNEDPSELGVSLVFVQDVMPSLPEHVVTVVDIRDANHGNIILEESELVNRRFAPDHFPVGFRKEDLSRALAPLNHVQNLKSAIPETVTFLEMYGVEKVEQLGLSQRWAQNETYKSLAVPLGLRGKDDIVHLNLHEKAHGPHGLVAGTTGSGKSEIIQSYIISLAVNFHPHEVAFLLIDYKGGGMANLFKDLPHLLGTITNLDGAQSMRALASIKAELEKRQRLFGEHDVNHINQYQKLYKLGEASEPMPHLFLISDEFAELKAEQPDFMQELVSTARIGRSLGIHLILATQKPSGVVDDQIWSNSKFKLALKVQDTSDSNEILKTPDAAEITLPGRAYLQVGNNEIYELFQSAWSGADYVPEPEDREQLDTTIYAINELGQYDILSQDLSGLGGKEEVEKIPTELEAVIDYIHQYAEQQQIEPLPRPWLPPLEEQIDLTQLHEVDYTQAWKGEKAPLEPMIGFADFPELQDQRPLRLNLTKDGHLLVVSSPGYGKSTFLQTVVMDLARTHHPGHLHVYLLDFGTNGLLPLRHLPHIADTFLVDENEKIGKLLHRLAEEIKTRKQKLSAYGVANIDMYEQASGDTVPHIILVIDNYDAVREADFVDEFEQLMTQIAREGGSVGLHLVISAGRQNALRMPLHSNIKIQIPLYLIDEMEARTIIGRTELEIEEIPGRGLIKLEDPALFQTALPAEGTGALEIIDRIQQESKEMDANWEGERPKPIPMMPEEIHLEDYTQKPEIQKVIQNQQLPLGLEYQNIEPRAHDFQKHDHLIVFSDDQNTLATLRESILEQFIEMKGTRYRLCLVDPDYSYMDYKEKVDHLISDAATGEEYVTKWVKEIRKRSQLLLKARQEARAEDPLKHMKRHLIFIPDAADFANLIQMTAEDALTLIEKGKDVGVYFILCSLEQNFKYPNDELTDACKSRTESAVIGMRMSDQSYFPSQYISGENQLDQDQAYYYVRGQYELIQMPRTK